MKRLAGRLLPRFALWTVILLYLVVIAGSIVRATGAGMGCPDWPKCYGKLIPPTRVEEIDFSRLDIEKYRNAWQRSGHDPIEVTEETLKRDFDAVATWTEFINRVFGMISGLAALATFFCAVIAVPHRRWLLVLLVLQLGLFGVVAWLGKVVVDTNLLPWKITLHMGLAVALVSTAIVIRHLTAPAAPLPVSRSLRRHLLAAFVLCLIQISVGTQVREVVDHLAAGECCDGRLEQRLGNILVWHRVGAIFTLTVVAVAFFRLKLSAAAGSAAPWLVAMCGLVVAVEYAAGVLLIRAGLPATLQPVHLVLAVILHGILLAMLLRQRLQLPAAGDKLPQTAAA